MMTIQDALALVPPPLISAAASIALVGGLLGAAAILPYAERRLLAAFQERIGPNRAGPYGILQFIADMLKILTKGDRVPEGGDPFIFTLAPAVAATPVLIAFGVIGFGPGIAVAPINVGVVFILGMAGLTVYGIILGAWASAGRYGILGGLRAAAQMLSYEVFMGIALMGVVALSGSFAMDTIVAAQRDLWFIVTQPLGAVLFFIAGIAAAHRLPFDLPESENDLVAGYMTDYAGLRFGMFFLGEYLAILLISALTATLFLGGWLGPLLPGPLWFGIKTALLAAFFILLRAALPRPRYDQLVSFAWIVALPLALLNLLATGALVAAGVLP